MPSNRQRGVNLYVTLSQSEEVPVDHEPGRVPVPDSCSDVPPLPSSRLLRAHSSSPRTSVSADANLSVSAVVSTRPPSVLLSVDPQ